ncbi:MAG: apolipoprotein N-acyltransferase [Thermodesulfobacteriota bacterium]|nr:apolipoprotein N-acyltransferase [Thermodesulfobacteriota bacterium]
MTRSFRGGAWILLAPVLSGLLFALAFPNTAWGYLAWVALIPLFSVMHNKPWRCGFSAGVVFFAIVLYWLNTVMVTYGHLPLVVSLLLYLLLVVYLASFWGGICWCSCRIEQRLNLPLPLVLPLVWVVFEFGRNFALTGFPWANIAYSQAPYPALVQGADLGGVYVLVFLLVLVNCAGVAAWKAYRSDYALPWRLLVLVLVLWLGHYGYGLWRLAQIDCRSGGDSLRVAMVQGNIEQSLKWNPDCLRSTLTTYQRLSAQTDTPDLIIWPESSTPFFYQDGGRRAGKVRSVARENRAMVLFGSPAYMQEVGQQTGEDGEKLVQVDNRRRYRYLNSAYLLSSQGQTMGRSDKVHLVPFGEYVPLSGVLGFVDRLVQGVGDFVSGVNCPLQLNGHQVGVLVCYEAIFPEIARHQVANGAGLLVNITNDAWFGDSSAPWQHLAMTRFRAVENRVWIARCANTGVTAIVDPTGRVVKHSRLFHAETVEGVVYFCDETSLYTRTGDTVPLLFCVVVVVWLWQSRKKSLVAH